MYICKAAEVCDGVHTWIANTSYLGAHSVMEFFFMKTQEIYTMFGVLLVLANFCCSIEAQKPHADRIRGKIRFTDGLLFLKCLSDILLIGFTFRVQHVLT